MQQWELAGFEGKSDTKHPLREGWNPVLSCLPLLHERSPNSLFSVPETNARTFCPSRSRLLSLRIGSIFSSASSSPTIQASQFSHAGRARPRFPSPLACLNPGWPSLCTGLRASMDLETENHLAALLVEEARRLRREAEKDGVHVYLQKPNVRGRPNSRFLTATVLGVEQANRAAEISEMWRAREKERELDAKQRHGSKDNRTGMNVRNGCLHENSKSWLEENSALVTSLDKCRKRNSPSEGSQSRHENDQRDHSRHCSSSKRYSEESQSSGFAGLHDDDIEEFLHSRVKRGRGSVGCRMDEPGPYLPSTSADLDEHSASSAKRAGEERKPRILGPEKPHFLKSNPAHIGVGYSMHQVTYKCKSEKDPYEEKRKSKREKSESKRRKEKSKNQKKHRRRDSGKLKAKYV